MIALEINIWIKNIIFFMKSDIFNNICLNYLFLENEFNIAFNLTRREENLSELFKTIYGFQKKF